MVAGRRVDEQKYALKGNDSPRKSGIQLAHLLDIIILGNNIVSGSIYGASVRLVLNIAVLQLLFLKLHFRMAEQDGQQIKVEPDDPEFALEEHIIFKRKQEAQNIQLKRLIQDNLSEFRLIMDGTTYSYTKLNLANKGLTGISDAIAEYPHLRVIEASNNQINETMHLQKLKYVVSLNLSRNIVTDGRFLSNSTIFAFVKTLNLSFNKLKSLPAINLNNIIHLNLTGNEIVSLEDFDGHPKLEVLELRGNKITSLSGIKNAISLRELYIADNAITSLKPLVKLPKLERLHVRKNKISDLTEFPQISTIKYLNLRENQIPKVNFLSGINKSVTIINLLANPISEQLGDNTKKQIWMKFRQYLKINKSQVTAQQRDEFDKQYKERIAEQQRQQKQARQQAQRQALQKQQQG